MEFRRGFPILKLVSHHAANRPPYAERREIQSERLGLPWLRTPTIGSFPHTARALPMLLRLETMPPTPQHDRDVIQSALREGLPLRRSQWNAYLAWAVACFRLATSGAGSATQIHTHMCYSAFNDIIDAIAALDADVISLENSRSGGELLEVFRQTSYDKEIGPGVYDIHSPRIPSVDEIEAMLRATLRVLPPANVWVNPDCGLKTRTWEEVIPALDHMVAAARQVRSSLPLPSLDSLDSVT